MRNVPMTMAAFAAVWVAVAVPLAHAASDMPQNEMVFDHQMQSMLIGSVECDADETLFVVPTELGLAPACLDDNASNVLMQGGADILPYEHYAQSATVIETINVGLATPVTGSIDEYGNDIRLGAELAERDFNAMLENMNATWRLNLVLADGMSSPAVTEQNIRKFAQNNYSVVVGPSIDIFDDTVTALATESEMLLVSCCSVTLDHAADDMLLRMTPPQTMHGRAVANVMHDDGIRHVILAGRDDAWVTNLLYAAAKEFERLGNSVGKVVIYGSDGKFGYEAMIGLNAGIINALKTYELDQIAILYVGFEETYKFVDHVAPHGQINTVRWYGADANTVRHFDTLDTARSLSFTSVQPTVATTDATMDLLDAAVESLYRPPSVYAYQAYDAVSLIGAAIYETSRYDAETVRNHMLSSNSSAGIDGSVIMFDENGDRESMRYAVWEILDSDWVVTDVRDGSNPGMEPSCRDVVLGSPVGTLEFASKSGLTAADVADTADSCSLVDQIRDAVDAGGN